MDVINVGVSLQCESQTNDVCGWQESRHRVHQRSDDTDTDEKHDKNNLAGFTLSSSPTFEYVTFFYIYIKVLIDDDKQNTMQDKI